MLTKYQENAHCMCTCCGLLLQFFFLKLNNCLILYCNFIINGFSVCIPTKIFGCQKFEIRKPEFKLYIHNFKYYLQNYCNKEDINNGENFI